jgi:hypothetical protein
VDVKEVLLPSIGVRYEFTSHDGERIGIIARRSGEFDVVRYARDDPDQAQPIFHFPATMQWGHPQPRSGEGDAQRDEGEPGNPT